MKVSLFSGFYSIESIPSIDLNDKLNILEMFARNGQTILFGIFKDNILEENLPEAFKGDILFLKQRVIIENNKWVFPWKCPFKEEPNMIWLKANNKHEMERIIKVNNWLIDCVVLKSDSDFEDAVCLIYSTESYEEYKPKHEFINIVDMHEGNYVKNTLGIIAKSYRRMTIQKSIQKEELIKILIDNMDKFQSVINYAIKLNGTICIRKTNSSRIICKVSEEHITGKTIEGYDLVNIVDKIHNIENSEVEENVSYLFNRLGFKYINESYEWIFFGMPIQKSMSYEYGIAFSKGGSKPSNIYMYSKSLGDGWYYYVSQRK
ncbi:hypothetical protein [Pseudobacteroides cellulosolvens]|uniref:Uncharacterized protein n=1 Tax=Pseudobacteroides cellulosolvens ATCC 35603 = DSM 2933 TaxID=398512 RepID=A0A0L6JJF4_9FIRM|nr:hypothetical protein [Pseudobacteroides cellulosolvens]KNY25884.1 hypothetical protein Bccel_1144 [Pseudobacteroides cellulosolvens ATCC 35603 = DSM 2933]